VTSAVSEGDAAHQIVVRATNVGSDLIVMGSRGMTGLRRILIGSVARNVLLHAPTSVLIVREPLREEAFEPAEERRSAGLLATAT
jgi:nucleotide-binding universal stress UspA family protein